MGQNQYLPSGRAMNSRWRWRGGGRRQQRMRILVCGAFGYRCPPPPPAASRAIIKDNLGTRLLENVCDTRT